MERSTLFFAYSYPNDPWIYLHWVVRQKFVLRALKRYSYSQMFVHVIFIARKSSLHPLPTQLPQYPTKLPLKLLIAVPHIRESNFRTGAIIVSPLSNEWLHHPFRGLRCCIILAPTQGWIKSMRSHRYHTKIHNP